MIGLWWALVACAPQAAAPPAPGSPLTSLGRTPDAPDVVGVVAEVLSAGGYAYLRVGDRWYATLDHGLQVGDAVRLDPIGRALDFYSRRTGRTFPELWFAAVSAGSSAMP